jgi:hypothetical protein
MFSPKFQSQQDSMKFITYVFNLLANQQILCGSKIKLKCEEEAFLILLFLKLAFVTEYAISIFLQFQFFLDSCMLYYNL